MVCSIKTPCECMVGGYLKPTCCPDEYRWAIDRLVDEFGEANVRVGWELDFGRTQKVAVSADRFLTIAAVQTLKGPHPDRSPRWYDLNDNRSDLEAFIERARPMVRGFGV